MAIMGMPKTSVGGGGHTNISEFTCISGSDASKATLLESGKYEHFSLDVTNVNSVTISYTCNATDSSSRGSMGYVLDGTYYEVKATAYNPSTEQSVTVDTSNATTFKIYVQNNSSPSNYGNTLHMRVEWT